MAVLANQGWLGSLCGSRKAQTTIWLGACCVWIGLAQTTTPHEWHKLFTITQANGDMKLSLPMNCFHLMPINRNFQSICSITTLKLSGQVGCHLPPIKPKSTDHCPQAKAKGMSVQDYVVESLHNGSLRFAAEQPDNPQNFPRNMFIWRSNLLGSSGKGMSTCSNTC